VTVISSIDQVTSVWLTQALRDGGHLVRGQAIAVEPAGGQAATGGPGFRPANCIRVCYSADAPSSAPTRLYLKTHDGAIYKEAGAWEMTFYTSVAPAMPYPPAARCYHAACDAETGVCHLLLADVSETHRTVHPEVPAPQKNVEQMVDALARLHAFWWGHPRLGEDIGERPTAASVAHDFARLRASFGAYVDFLGDRLSPQRRRIYEDVLDRFPDTLARRLVRRERLTVVHNDAHAGNFLLACEPAAGQSYIVDWEQWGLGAGPRDVAYLIAVF
jgi:hypothetical protein